MTLRIFGKHTITSQGQFSREAILLTKTHSGWKTVSLQSRQDTSVRCLVNWNNNNNNNKNMYQNPVLMFITTLCIFCSSHALEFLSRSTLRLLTLAVFLPTGLSTFLPLDDGRVSLNRAIVFWFFPRGIVARDSHKIKWLKQLRSSTTTTLRDCKLSRCKLSVCC